MRILVFGAAGQVGSAFADLAGDRHEVIVPPRDKADFSNPDRIAALVRTSAADLVVNCAAYTQVDRAESEQETAMLVNAETPAAIAAAAAEMNIWLVQFSTDYVFDGAADHPYLEDDPVMPLGVYGRTKYQGEQGVRAVLDNHLILRTSWVYSHTGHNFVRTMLRLAGERDHLKVVTDQTGCPTYAPDLARACLAMVEESGTSGPGDRAGTYHLSGADRATWYEFARAVFATAGVEVEVEAIATSDYPTPAPRPSWSVLDNGRARRRFGVSIPGYRDALPRCLAALG